MTIGKVNRNISNHPGHHKHATTFNTFFIHRLINIPMYNNDSTLVHISSI